jgi:O-antigen ligase
MLVWLAGWAAGKLEARWSWRFLPFLGVIVLGYLQLWRGWTVYTLATTQDILRWATYAVIFFLAFQLFSAEDSARAFRRLFLFYALVVAVVSLLQWFGGKGEIFGLFDAPEAGGMGPFLNRDHYATFVVLALPVGLVDMLRQPRQRWGYMIASAALYASVIACGSRAGFILATAELVLLFIPVLFSSRMAGAALGLILVFGSVVGWDYLFGRFNDHDPYAGRREVAEATLSMAKASPVHGFGLGTWATVYPAFARKDFGLFINAAHNDWLQWGADGGVPMLSCILALFAGSLLIVRRVPWAVGVPFVFVHCLIDFPMQGRFLPAVVFLVFGIAASAAGRGEEPSESERSQKKSHRLFVKADAL